MNSASDRIQAFDPPERPLKSHIHCSNYGTLQGCVKGNACDKLHAPRGHLELVAKNTAQLDHIASTQDKMSDHMARLNRSQMSIAADIQAIEIKMRSLGLLQPPCTPRS